jgi:hypothetical protein
VSCNSSNLRIIVSGIALAGWISSARTSTYTERLVLDRSRCRFTRWVRRVSIISYLSICFSLDRVWIVSNALPTNPNSKRKICTHPAIRKVNCISNGFRRGPLWLSNYGRCLSAYLIVRKKTNEIHRATRKRRKLSTSVLTVVIVSSKLFGYILHIWSRGFNLFF